MIKWQDWRLYADYGDGHVFSGVDSIIKCGGGERVPE
jgi:hypothetical protein